MSPATPGPGETLDRLSNRRSVLQRQRGHRSATDDILAAWSALRARPDARRVLDLGCGHGTVGLLLSAVLPEVRFVGVEAQEVSADLARRNLALNGLEHRARILHRDLRGLRADELGRFDLVTGTPPFMPPGSGPLPQDPQRAAARFELRGGVEAYCAAAAALLEPAGAVSLLMDGAQDARCRRAFSEAGLHLVATVVVLPRPDRAPRYRAYVATREAAGGPEASLELCVRDARGRYTEAMLAARELVDISTPLRDPP